LLVDADATLYEGSDPVLEVGRQQAAKAGIHKARAACRQQYPRTSGCGVNLYADGLPNESQSAIRCHLVDLGIGRARQGTVRAVIELLRMCPIAQRRAALARALPPS